MDKLYAPYDVVISLKDYYTRVEWMLFAEEYSRYLGNHLLARSEYEAFDDEEWAILTMKVKYEDLPLHLNSNSVVLNAVKFRMRIGR